MENLIQERKKIVLPENQLQLIKSGWGEEAIYNTTVEKITYLSDGLKVTGYVAYPKNTSVKCPCIIWNRGGYGNAGAIDSFNAMGIFGQIANWGYMVFASQYRGNDGGEGKDEFGGSDINDILNLIPLANYFPQANSEIWGIEGWSRGGMMTYLTLTIEHRFKAAIVTGGIADLKCTTDNSRFMKKLSARILDQLDNEKYIKDCNNRSIVNKADKLSKNTPLLILHGTADERVLPQDSLDLSYKLLENKIPFRLILLEGGDHFLKKHRKFVDSLRKEWFQKHLQQI
jgi:dipeptidyl aminopeptidase/acylaminoacyl peptidase